jgi:NADH-quinone oxidoreductase subunit C
METFFFLLSSILVVTRPLLLLMSINLTHSLISRLHAIFPAILSFTSHGDLFLKVRPTHLLPLLTLLRSHTGFAFAQLLSVTITDYPERKDRFEAAYLLLSPFLAQRVTVLVSVPEGDSIPSVVSLYPSAGWYEREAWDRFGVPFAGHPDLRRRLTDYGFKGHPLRKDFPVTGYVEVRYDERGKRIIYEGVSLPQEYRLFTFDTPFAI